MKIVVVTAPKRLKDISVTLPSSKSISNRLLMLEAYAGKKIRKQNLSAATDTKELHKALNQKGNHIDAGNGGSTYRFLLSYFAWKKGKWILDCGDQMKQRPIKDLVDAWKKAGIQIRYLEKTGYPPLEINSTGFNGNNLKINSDKSSQFISSLLLMAPFLREKITISLNKEKVSSSYIDLTLDLLSKFNVRFEVDEDKITIRPGYKFPASFKVEPDWSSTAFFYEIAALSRSENIVLKDLNLDSVQGDKKIKEFAEIFGIRTIPLRREILLDRSGPVITSKKVINLSSTPDLFPALLCMYAGIGIPVAFTGIYHLQYKETDRLENMISQLSALGISFRKNNDGISVSGLIKKKKFRFDSHGDHRLAMAFAPLSCVMNDIEITDPDCVEKSFPGYWTTLKKLGFGIHFKEVN